MSKQSLSFSPSPHTLFLYLHCHENNLLTTSGFPKSTLGNLFIYYMCQHNSQKEKESFLLCSTGSIHRQKPNPKWPWSSLVDELAKKPLKSRRFSTVGTEANVAEAQCFSSRSGINDPGVSRGGQILTPALSTTFIPILACHDSVSPSVT